MWVHLSQRHDCREAHKINAQSSILLGHLVLSCTQRLLVVHRDPGASLRFTFHRSAHSNSVSIAIATMDANGIQADVDKTLAQYEA